jgi:Protein of unknown function (DUF3710)
MAFGRAKKDKSAPGPIVGSRAGGLEPDDVAAADDDDEPTAPGVAGSAGAADNRRPLDEAEAGDDAAMPRLDLGSMRVPVLPETEVRVELNDQQQAIAATVLHAGSSLQVLAFAAPRNDGIWDEVRAEIAESIRTEGGQVDEVDGPFGAELHARVRSQPEPGKVVEQPLRFVGFDGPRWFLRGVFSGPAATNPPQAGVLETVLTSVVVVRGNEAMAPRDPLPLRLPHDVVAPPGAPAAEAATPLSADPLTRGPEITETR